MSVIKENKNTKKGGSTVKPLALGPISLMNTRAKGTRDV